MTHPSKRQRPSRGQSKPITGVERKVGRRQQASEERRQAIIAAALEVFAADGFAAARLEDIADKAGVAKGTIYLSFKDKEHLFEQLLVTAVAPVLARVEALASGPAMPLDTALETLFAYFRTEVLATHRRELIRLVLAEGRRFPRIAEIYHREVVSRGLALIRRMARNAHERGELSHNELQKFPHLVFAPLLLAVIWDGLFSGFEPLDVEGMLVAHRSLITADTAHPKHRDA